MAKAKNKKKKVLKSRKPAKKLRAAKKPKQKVAKKKAAPARVKRVPEKPFKKATSRPELKGKSQNKVDALITLDFLNPEKNATIGVRPHRVYSMLHSDFTGSVTRWSFDEP